MGKRGPAPTPTKLLEGRGSWRAKTRKGEPQPKVERPACPAFLKGEAKTEWGRQVEALEAVGLLAKCDRAALALFCEAWGEFVQAEKFLRENGLTFQSGAGVKTKGDAVIEFAGEPKLHPIYKVKVEAAKRVLALAAQFGFTPAARARLQSPEGKGVPDEMEAFLTPKGN